MKYKLRKTPEQVIEMIKSSVSLAASLTSNVEFSCEDASRSDKDFLCRACGTDAMGEVTVRIAENGFSTIGRGAHPDIIVASAKAYVNALNHLVQAEKEGHKIHCQLDDENA